jgi:UDP-glucose 4,6-dehydratase
MLMHPSAIPWRIPRSELPSLAVPSSDKENPGNPCLIFRCGVQTNVLGTHTLLECAKQHKIKRFIHVSTDEVYGDVFGEGATENATLEPTNPYSCSKAAAEFICKAYMRSYRLPVIITRGNNVYGPNQYPEKVIPKFILRLMRGEKACIHGTGEALRSYVHVDDVVRAFDTILHRGTDNCIYNIGTRFEISVEEIARSVVRALGLAGPGAEDPHIERVADRNINDLRYCIDDSKLAALGWAPTVPWSDGLAATVAWYRAMPHDHWSDWASALRPHPLIHLKGQ